MLEAGDSNPDVESFFNLPAQWRGPWRCGDACGNEPSLFKVGDLAQLVKASVAYWLGALPKFACSNPGGSMKITIDMCMPVLLWMICIYRVGALE